MGENAFGESKRTLADKLYRKLDDEFCDIGEFASVVADVLKDYALVLKTGIID